MGVRERRLARAERWYSGVERPNERTEWVYDAYGRVSTVSYMATGWARGV
jgi:hypothetical protein